MKKNTETKFELDITMLEDLAIKAYNKGAQEQLPKAIARYTPVCKFIGKAKTEAKVGYTMVKAVI